jgi:beta-lactamase regulating signal transducer with metallopeptidase domain
VTTDLMAFLIGSAVRASVVLGFTWALTRSMRRASASTRHFIWTCAIAAVTLVPVTTAVIPQWRVLPPAAVASLVSAIAPPAPDVVAADRRDATAAVTPSSARTTLFQQHVAPPAPSTTVQSARSYAGVVTSVWAAGTTAVLIYLTVGFLAAWRIRRSAVRLDTPWAEEAQVLARALEIRGHVACVESAKADTPMVCGFWRPMIVMPQGASQWPAERLHVVVLHELAHIKRRDCLTQAVAKFVCAAYWFNPLVWVAARRLRTERERACDDVVLATGTAGSEYASHLLEIARAMRPRRSTALASSALAMAHRSQLEARLMAILDPATRRSSALHARFAAAAAVLLISIPVAAVQPKQSAVAPLDPSGEHFQWSGSVAQGKTIEIRGVGGSIRAISSEDGSIHVDARRSDPASVRIDVVEHDQGVTICAAGERWQSADCRFGVRPPNVRAGDVRVDFVVGVPAGVHFAGSMIDGDIAVERVRSEISAATINGGVNIQTMGFAAQATTIEGNVVLELPGGGDAELHANTIKGTIESEFPLRFSNSGPFLLPAPPSLPGGGAGGPGFPPQIVRATIGQGGPELRVTTISGNIRLRRR